MATEWPPVFVKAIPAKTMQDGMAALQRDTQAAWNDGYALTSQPWVPGGRTPAGIICLILGVLLLLGPVPLGFAVSNPIPVLIVVLIGVFFVYAGVVSKTPGMLTATFSRQR